MAAPPIALDYRPSSAFDEMCFPDGTLRPHWESFGKVLKSFSPADLDARRDTVQRLLRDHGVTYNVYGDATGFTRPWSLDLLPVIIAAEDYRIVSDGLKQRARLFNLILADLYGQQRLLKEGWIPPAVLHANPGFIRAIQGVMPQGGEISRGLRHRSRAFGGRLVGRVVRPHAVAIRQGLLAREPHCHDKCVRRRVQGVKGAAARRILRHGARGVSQSCAFEARHSIGGDAHAGPLQRDLLRARLQGALPRLPAPSKARISPCVDRRVHLKTLEGLRRVDVIARRVDEGFCDPLELKSETWLGVPGLVEAWRSGNVALANGPGAGAVETPALFPFLPGLCRHLLGEELKLPCAPTWWCGQQRELKMVLASPERWVLKPAFAVGSRDPLFLAELDEEKRAEAIDRVRAEPHAWVAQEALTLSTTPTLVNGTLQPRSLVWRAFTLASGDGHHVMPGGLSRVSAEPGRFVVTMQSGGISKDTWVIAEGQVDQTTLLQDQTLVIRPARPPGGVPSRVADHLFWLGRYAERLEQTVRVLRTIWQRLSGEGSDVQGHELRGCAHLLAALKLVPQKVANDTDTRTLLTHLRALLHDPKCEGSVRELLGKLRFNAASARDRLSDDTWRLFNRLERDVHTSRKGLAVSDAVGMLDTLILDLAAFSGMQIENMTHGHGWRFLEIGRRVERTLVVLVLAGDAARIAAHDDSVLTPLLEICDSSMTYRRLHFARPRLVPVLDLLLLNESNPRSVAYQIEALRVQSQHLPVDPQSALAGREKALSDALRSTLGGLNLDAFATRRRRPSPNCLCFARTFSPIPKHFLIF